MHIYGLTYEEAGDRVGISRQKIGSRLSRLRENSPGLMPNAQEKALLRKKISYDDSMAYETILQF